MYAKRERSPFRGGSLCCGISDDEVVEVALTEPDGLEYILLAGFFITNDWTGRPDFLQTQGERPQTERMES